MKASTSGTASTKFPFGEGTLAALVEMCRERIWPLLKNSTRINYDFFLDTHILPNWGSVKLTKMRTIELQDFFDSFSPRLAPETIRNVHACLGTVLTQGKTWGIIRVNPAQGVRRHGRAEFIDELSHRRIAVVQVTAEDLQDEIDRE